MLWKDIPGYEGLYRVSENGDVMSLPRTIASQRYASGVKRIKGGLLRGFVKDGNRRSVRLVDSEGKTERWYVAHLVALAFIGPWPDGAECVRHLNDDPSNDQKDNLAYGTIANNVADSIANGTFPRGEKNGHAKLTAADVVAIREAIRCGKRGIQTELATRYGVAQSVITKIKWGHSWAHVALVGAAP